MNLQRYFHFFKKNFLFFVFFVVNIAFLSQYPFIHSDESWLSGLTKAMIENKNFAATEPFFDLMPRFPHAIKILFHFLQIPFLLVFGYGPFSARLPSLLAGTASLVVFYKIMDYRTPGNAGGHGWTAAGLTFLLALDIQFLYASHFARQEILLVLCLLTAVYFYWRGKAGGERKWYWWSALTICLSIGVHPNSFLIALPIGGFLLLDLLSELTGYIRGTASSEADQFSSLKRIIAYIAILGLGALFFAGLSCLMDPAFLRHYGSFGAKVGVAEPLYMKFFTFPDFYEKIFRRISGTYYLPDIRFQFYLFGAVLFFSLPALLLCSRFRMSGGRYLFGILLLNIGTLFLGKYSQPSIILHFPLYYLLLGGLFRCSGSEENPGRSGKIHLLPVLVLLLLLSAQAGNTGMNLAETSGTGGTASAETYREYKTNIRRFIPSNARVLANLNAEYCFDFGALRDYRNLAYLEGAGLDFAGYIEKNHIRYILYPEEMDLIHERRPVWNILYGNVNAYYDDMKNFLSDRCEEIGTFSSPVYGMRITRYSGRRNWITKVYQVVK